MSSLKIQNYEFEICNKHPYRINCWGFPWCTFSQRMSLINIFHIYQTRTNYVQLKTTIFYVTFLYYIYLIWPNSYYYLILALNNQMGNCNNSTMANLIMKYGGKPMEITPGCKLTCSQVLTDIVTCGTKTIGNRTLLNVLYFLFRYVVSMCMLTLCNR